MKTKHILITGVTGVLGSRLLKILLNETNSILYLLVRSEDSFEAQSRVQDLIDTTLKGKISRDVLKRIVVVSGRIEEEDFGLDNSFKLKLAKEINEIYHCAAITGFRISYEIAKKINFEGTRNVLEFAKACSNLDKIFYISTVFILGSQEYTLKENELNVGQKFNNHYEKSKYETEMLINEYRNLGYNIFIFRPSIISGDYATGEISNFKLLYEAIHLCSKEIVETLPFFLDLKHNLIPADIAARAIYLLSGEKIGQNYHIISSNNIDCRHFFTEAAKFFGYKNPQWVSFDVFKFHNLSAVKKALLEPFLPYFNYRGSFSSQETRKVLKRYDFIFPPIDDDYLRRTFKYCIDVGYIKRRIN